MSKEMTPKESLEKLNNFISREKHIDSERNKTINKCVDTLSQALDHLEQLEIADRNNQNLVKTNVELVNENLELQKENQELLMAIENKNNEIKNLKKLICDNPYKKVIDILKEKANIRLHILTNTDGSKIYEIEFIFTYYSTIHEITKQEFDLLKEFLK